MAKNHDQYAYRDTRDLGDYYIRHVQAMTREALRSKADIAAELAWRDREIDRLRTVAQQASHAAEYPAGAISNGRACIEQLEQLYEFECRGGPLVKRRACRCSAPE